MSRGERKSFKVSKPRRRARHRCTPLVGFLFASDDRAAAVAETKLSYDADGNLIDDGASEYAWDARGQLSTIKGAAKASFAYDPFGRRISKTLGETTTGLLYDGTNVVQEYSGEELTATLLTGLAPDQLFSRDAGEGTESYLTDRLGSVIALADAAGEVDTTYSYEPFGAASTAGAPSDNPFQFTGRENDGTGLQYNRARYYDPSIARFISQDPAGFAGSGTNPYWYANGNPLDFIDPSGEIGIPPLPSPSRLVEDAINQIGKWVSNAPGVASDAKAFLAEQGESLADTVGNAAECPLKAARHPTETQECLPDTPETWQPTEPEEPPNSQPPSPPPPVPSIEPKPGRAVLNP